MAPRTAALSLFMLLAVAATSAAQQSAPALHGATVDSAGTPLARVRVDVVELGRHVLTGEDGRFAFADLPSGRFTVSLSRPGLAPRAVRVVIPRDEQLRVILREGLLHLAPVQVTATTGATRAQDAPQPVAILEGAALRTAQGAALGETLEQIPGIRSLGMSTGIGKPVIRGMTHYRVVTLDNGQRTETQAWGHDHSPNVETASAARVEVIKGPASVLYGSDALGGVVNVIAPSVPDAIDVPTFARGRLGSIYQHGTRGRDATLDVEAASAGFGVRGALTGRTSGDMRTPDGPLHNTGNRALSTELAAGHRGGWGALQARYTGRDERIEIFDDPVANPDYTGFQRIATNRGTVELTAPVAGARLQVNLGYENNLRREFADRAAVAPDLGLYVRNWTGFAHLHHAPLGAFSGTVGVSGMTSDFENRGTEALIPASGTRQMGIYTVQETERGRWRTTLGGRYDYRTLSTDGDEELDVHRQRRTFHALTGSIGTLYRVSEPVVLVFNVARGFRAPAAPDLFANGFHEGTRAFERGDPDLRVETSLNTEVGVRVEQRTLSAELSAFVNHVRDYIYLRPFGATGGAFDSLQVVQGNARLTGVEARLAYRPAGPVTLHVSGDFVHGQNTSADIPLTFIPPLRVVYGARLEPSGDVWGMQRPYVTVTAESNASQRRIDPRDVSTGAYTLTSVGSGFTRLIPRGALTVDLSVRNVFDVRYRSFMSRYKEFAIGPGRSVVLRVSTSL